MQEVIPKRRRLVDPNLQNAEQRDLTASAKVFVMTRPSERRSIFTRFRDKSADPNTLASETKIDRPTVLQIVRVVSREREQESWEDGFRKGRLSAFAEISGGPGPTAPAARPLRSHAVDSMARKRAA